MGLPPLCTVGAAEFEPPASGKIALFSIAMEFDVFSPPVPVVAADDDVQLVSCFSLDGVDCAAAAPTTNEPARIATAKRIIFISRDRKSLFQIQKAERSAMTMVPLGSFSGPIRPILIIAIDVPASYCFGTTSKQRNSSI